MQSFSNQTSSETLTMPRVDYSGDRALFSGLQGFVNSPKFSEFSSQITQAGTIDDLMQILPSNEFDYCNLLYRQIMSGEKAPPIPELEFQKRLEQGIIPREPCEHDDRMLILDRMAQLDGYKNILDGWDKRNKHSIEDGLINPV